LLKSALARFASVVLSHPRARQWILGIVEALPSSWEARLRQLVTPGAQLPPPVTLPWPLSAMTATERQLYHALRRRVARKALNPSQSTKPRLAYFSPMPPQRSGISNYSLMLIPRLAAHYDIDIIVDQERTTVPWSATEYPVRDLTWFRAHAHEFDRVLYHFGNAPFHSHMFELLETWPGAVMLHDFFLGHLVAHIDALNPGYLGRSLYEGWGYGPLQTLQTAEGKERVIWEYPLNAAVLRHARGMIAHSPFSVELASRYFGETCQQSWHVVPHLKEPANTTERDAARHRLGLASNSFVVCSFGHITPTKCHDRLVDAWFASALATNQNSVLVFVGEKPTGLYGSTLLQKIQAHPRGKSIQITGWADADTFEDYLQAADVAVQLRSHSRGETSGAVIDCMNHGLATIVNAHGTMADLPADAVYVLADEFSVGDLTDALNYLWRNESARHALGARARAAIRSLHDPQSCARLYKDAIEAMYLAPQSLDSTLDQALENISQPSDAQLVELARTLAGSWAPPLRARQLLVDVSAIARTDLKTGIERVVRAQLLELLRSPPTGWRIEPVYLEHSDDAWRYRYARRYTCQLLDVTPMLLADDVVDFGRDDILYIPDLFPQGTVAAQRQGLFDDIKAKGTIINVLVHDLLPVTLPQHFPAGASQNHERWLSAISAVADRLLCISQAVAADLQRWGADHGQALPPVAINHHGADIEASSTQLRKRKPTRRARKLLSRLAQAPTFLMVGTIEPRKGYLQALAAFDLVWNQGSEVNLVIVGKEGWRELPTSERGTIPAITRQLDLHPRRNKNLFWLSDIDDLYLDALYDASQCLVAASADEGFGLPLIEAARHGVPVLARDIPVFREVAAEGTCYFRGETPTDLADAIRDWLTKYDRGDIAPPQAVAVRTWAENVSDLKSILLS